MSLKAGIFTKRKKKLATGAKPNTLTPHLTVCIYESSFGSHHGQQNGGRDERKEYPFGNAVLLTLQ